MDTSVVLPNDCISEIISRTRPGDAFRCSAVSSLFKLIAESDAVWEKILPSGYQERISPGLLTTKSKKDLYLHLCDPIIINNGTMSSAIEKESGKKCFMVGARGLFIAWGDEESPYWRWPSLPESRFAQVAELNFVWSFDVKGEIDTAILSPKTAYAAYLVFKLSGPTGGFSTRPVKLGVYLAGKDNGKRRIVLLDPPRDAPMPSVNRGDGWLEIEMGEFFNENGDDGTLICSVFDFDSNRTKRGVIIEGIELRPENGR